MVHTLFGSFEDVFLFPQEAKVWLQLWEGMGRELWAPKLGEWCPTGIRSWRSNGQRLEHLPRDKIFSKAVLKAVSGVYSFLPTPWNPPRKIQKV